MTSRFDPSGALLGVLAGLAAALVTTLIALAGMAPAAAVAVGFASGFWVFVFHLLARAVARNRWQREMEQNGTVLRELVRVTVPRATDLATDENGCVDPDRFRDLLAASITKQIDRRVGLGDMGPAVWEMDGRDARNEDQGRRLDVLLTYPDVADAIDLMESLNGMGPQTIHQFFEYAIDARERLRVGLEPIRAGSHDAVLTGHLITAGLVQQVDGPVPGADQTPDSAYYSLTPRGCEVARLFAPTTVRPRELAALDPTETGDTHSPPRPGSHGSD